MLGQFTSVKSEVEEADRQQRLSVANENSLSEGEAGGGLNGGSELVREEQLKNVNGGKLNILFINYEGSVSVRGRSLRFLLERDELKSKIVLKLLKNHYKELSPSQNIL